MGERLGSAIIRLLVGEAGTAPTAAAVPATSNQSTSCFSRTGSCQNCARQRNLQGRELDSETATRPALLFQQPSAPRSASAHGFSMKACYQLQSRGLLPSNSASDKNPIASSQLDWMTAPAMVAPVDESPGKRAETASLTDRTHSADEVQSSNQQTR